jgi:hypothetical protein
MGPEKFILIGSFQVPYTCSDRVWDAPQIDQIHARILMMQSQQNAAPPPLQWYSLNKIGHPNYSVSRECTVVKTHSRRTETKGSKRENGRIRFCLYHPSTRTHKTVYLDEIAEAIFGTPKLKKQRDPTIPTRVADNSTTMSGEVWVELQIQGFEATSFSSAGRIKIEEHCIGFGKTNAQGFMEVDLKKLEEEEVEEGEGKGEQGRAKSVATCRVDELVMLAFHGTEKIQRWKQEGRTLHHLHGNSMDNDLRTMAYLHQMDQAGVAGASREALTVLHNTIHELHAQGKIGYYHACDLLKFHFGPPLRQ